MEHNKDATWLREIKKDTNFAYFPGEAKEDIEEDSELEFPWTR